MSKGKNGWGLIIFLIILIMFLGIIDIFANIISLIPGIGDIAETTSETVLEFMQIVLTIILAAVAKLR